MASEITMKRGDTLPALRITLSVAGEPFDLTAVSPAAIKFNYQVADKTVAGVVGGGSFAVVDATAGIVDYSWAAADTDTVGLYLAEIEINSGGRMTFPNDGDLRFRVLEDLADG